MWVVLHVFDERFPEDPTSGEELTFTCYVCSPENFPDPSTFHIIWPAACGLPRSIAADIERDLQPVLRQVDPAVLRQYTFRQDIDVILRWPSNVVEADWPRHGQGQ